MTDRTEMKRLALAATQGEWRCSDKHDGRFWHISCGNQAIGATHAASKKANPAYAEMFEANAKFIAAANPAAVLALIAENERLTTENSEIESAAITYIEDMQEAQHENERLTELFKVGMTLDGNLRVYGDWQSVRKAQEILAERDQLRAEVAGLKTGYEAYERVNAELKAEVEALRKDAERYRWLRDSDYAGKILRDMGAKYRADADQRIDAALGQGEQS